MPIKQGVRILAIDDSAFSKKDKEALVVGVVGRQDLIEGLLSFSVRVDGSDATGKIISKVRSSHFSDQIRLIALHGVTLAGLNMVDIEKVGRELGVPVVSIIRRKPHSSELEKAIRSVGKSSSSRLALLKRLNKSMKIERSKGFYVQRAGIKKEEFARFQDSAVHLLRLAHIIANGVATGESRGRV
ncbi:MAG: DUF99 family protein [Candidatus Micrarchaeota archaeon]|nr:DUF99 family protein [Candidatus Micrarchaeota archaeon]